MKRKQYEESFKREVVAAIEGGLSPTKAAEQFQVPPPNITLWKKRYAKPQEHRASTPIEMPAASLEAFWEIAQALAPLSQEDREKTLGAVQQALKHFSK